MTQPDRQASWFESRTGTTDEHEACLQVRGDSAMEKTHWLLTDRPTLHLQPGDSFVRRETVLGLEGPRQVERTHHVKDAKRARNGDFVVTLTTGATIVGSNDDAVTISRPRNKFQGAGIVLGKRTGV